MGALIIIRLGFWGPLISYTLNVIRSSQHSMGKYFRPLSQAVLRQLLAFGLRASGSQVCWGHGPNGSKLQKLRVSSGLAYYPYHGILGLMFDPLNAQNPYHSKLGLMLDPP